MASCVEMLLEADNNLDIPPAFKVFEPCARDMHEYCSVQTPKVWCICSCHLKEDENEEDGQD